MKKLGIIIAVIFMFFLIVSVILLPKVDVLEISKISSDLEYQRYIDLKGNGKIDDQGNYDIKYLDKDTVRVTFATNNQMNIEYYSDKQMEQKLDNVAYLAPGDTIYLKYIESKGRNKDQFLFDKYEIYSFSEDNKREQIVELTEPVTYYKIPQKFEKNEIQIVPLGKYKKDTINLFVKDEKNAEISSGTWKNNDIEIVHESVSVGPNEDYNLTYEYKSDEFFFVSATPKVFNHDPINGKVVFNTYNSSENKNYTTFTVELRRYFSLDINSDHEANIKLNGEEIKNKCQTCTIDSKNKLKFGDKILIETSGNITLETSDYEYLDISREWHKSSKTFIYTIIMNDNAEENSCDGVKINKKVTIELPSSNAFGKAIYTVNNKEKNGFVDLNVGDELVIEYEITNSAYIFKDNNAFENLIKIKTKKKTITIDSKMDDTTLDLSKYFEIEKRENK